MRIRMKKKQNKKLHSHSASHSVFVLEAGLEPARANAHRILSPACLPFHHSSILCVGYKKGARMPPSSSRARNGIRTRDPDLGKVVLYQLSYSRIKFYNSLCLENLVMLYFAEAEAVFA